jgi:hypothetical protein
MTGGQDIVERNNLPTSVEGQPTNVILVQTCKSLRIIAQEGHNRR